jgi:nucleoside-diphosphate-sugar epimerase
MSNTTRVLVTGAAGFAGRVASRTLLEQGYEVRAAVRNAETVMAGAEPVALGDFRAVTDWRPALRAVDTVVHLAGRAHVLAERPGAALQAARAANVAVTAQLADAAARSSVRRFVYISTIGVLGTITPDGHAFTEQDVPAARSPYAISKLEAERCLASAAAMGLEVVVIRPTLVYGPGAPGNLRLLTRWVRTGLPLPFASVRNQRSFLAVENLASLIACAVRAACAAGRTYLAADADVVSTPAAVRAIAEGMGRPARLVPVPASLIRTAATMAGRRSMGEGLCASLRVDAARARQELGWQPVVSTLDGLRRMGESALAAG